MNDMSNPLPRVGDKPPVVIPIEEETVVHFHRMLAEYMGTGAPVPIETGA